MSFRIDSDNDIVAPIVYWEALSRIDPDLYEKAVGPFATRSEAEAVLEKIRTKLFLNLKQIQDRAQMLSEGDSFIAIVENATLAEANWLQQRFLSTGYQTSYVERPGGYEFQVARPTPQDR
ncbi:hypothetical protein HY407_04475 [Candidatus Gottesmanbacteria bacterium]|nr:hypothetical protein [Candidatus Gottesmanbacteria bacterium]